jgi:hypothetical protein
VIECWLASTRKENSAGADDGVEDGCICRQGHAGWLDGIAGCRYGMQNIHTDMNGSTQTMINMKENCVGVEE